MLENANQNVNDTSSQEMSQFEQTSDIQNNQAEQNSVVIIRCRQIQPDCDIEEAKDDYIVSVDMPGVDSNSIDVKLDKDILTVSARSEIEGLAPRQYFRQFRVMRGLDAAKCRADYKQGVLVLRLARPQLAKPQQIHISCEG